MRVRVRVPTVLSRIERPFVEVILDEDHWSLTRAEAQCARDWMTFAGTWLNARSSWQVGEALENALAVLTAQPPRRIEDHVIGALQGQLSSGEPAWLELSVEMGLRDPAQPRIQLNLAESLAEGGDEPFYADTWWIDVREAAELAALLRAGAGELGNFLSVRAAVDPEHERTEGVELRFADDLLAERGDDGIFWLTTANARRVADWVDAAIDYAAKNPPHVWLPPEPDPITVGEIEA